VILVWKNSAVNNSRKKYQDKKWGSQDGTNSGLVDAKFHFFADAKGCGEMPQIAVLSAAPQHSSTGMAPGVAETMRM
jgi:hypothetical protein